MLREKWPRIRGSRKVKGVPIVCVGPFFMDMGV